MKEGRVIIVTGASSGIGRALAERAARKLKEGARDRPFRAVFAYEAKAQFVWGHIEGRLA